MPENNRSSPVCNRKPGCIAKCFRCHSNMSPPGRIRPRRKNYGVFFIMGAYYTFAGGGLFSCKKSPGETFACKNPPRGRISPGKSANRRRFRGGEPIMEHRQPAAYPIDRLPAVRYDWLACGTPLSCRRRRTRRIVLSRWHRPLRDE